MPDTERLIKIYHEATAWPPGPEREDFLEASCGDEPGLKEQVMSLLRSHQNAGGFLQEPIFPPTPVISEKPGDGIGRYKLLEKLGEGGCGVVYLAEQTEPVRRRVALKVIKLGMDTKQVIARFEAERQALALMDHPNIARVLDAGSTETGRPYFVMDLVRGLKITDYCDRNSLSIRERLNLFTKVCHAIQHAHQKGVIHRDIKPSNILVTLHDGVPVPKVIDFGIAKATEGRLAEGTIYTQFLHFVGTPAYMSPEQAEMSGLDIDTRSDIYSLGVLLYELLTGQTPFDGQRLVASGIDEMRKTIREQEPVRPSTRLGQALGAAHPQARFSATHPALSTDLDWIVMKCLEKDRTRRYDTANGLASDLNRHLHDEPVTARPPSRVYKLQKAWRRNRVGFAAAGAVTIALLLGTGLSIWQASEAWRARDVAQAERDKARTAQNQEKQARQESEYNLYVSNINRAGQAWEHHNVERLQQILTETRAFPGRGFEWFYWQRQAHLNLTSLRGHLSGISSVAFSPDGRQIITGGADQTARVWDAATGQQLFVLVGHKSEVTSATFSPDGKLIVTGGSDQTVRVWDVATRQKVFEHIGHKAGITSVAFSPNGLRIVSTGYDATAKVWETRSDQEPLTLRGHASNVFSGAFSPDGRRIVTGSEDGTARVWDAVTSREILRIHGHGEAVSAARFSSDGLRVLTGSVDRTARLWDAVTGSHLKTFAAPAPIAAVDISGDGKRVVTGSYDSIATVWDAMSGEKLRTVGADARSVATVAFSPEGERFVTGGGDGTAKVWETSGVSESLVLRGSTSSILAVGMAPDGQRVVTAGGPGLDLASSTNEAAQVWDSISGKELFTLNGHTSGISSTAYSPDGRWIVTGSADQTARLWAAGTGQPVRTFHGHQGAVHAVAFSPDSQRLLTGGEDRTAKMWDVATGSNVFNLPNHKGPVRAVAVSPKGQRIATGDWEGTVTLWQATSGTKRKPIEHTHLIRALCVAFSPEGQRVVAGGWPRSAIVWDAETGREIFELRGHLSPVSAVAFSPDGERIVTSGYDRCAKLWDAKTGRELLSLDEMGDVLSSVAFSPDGQRIVTGNWNKTARAWEAARADQVIAWEVEERAALESRDRWEEELAALLRGL